MKTGFNNVLEPELGDDDFAYKVSCGLQLLLEDAMTTAAEYTKAAGRNCITSEDMRIALMYECHEFWKVS